MLFQKAMPFLTNRMRKFFAILIIVVFVFIAYSSKNNAESFNIPTINLPPIYFAGEILNTKSAQVESYEGGGYICEVPGETIEIKPIKGQSSYLIPEGTKPKTNHLIRTGQNIIGVERGSTTINCKRCETKTGNSSGSEKKCWKASFDLPNIIIFGTSRY